MSEILIIGIMSYLVTGLALTGYDFSAPAIHRKVYVIKKDYKVAAFTCFTWPYFVIYEAYQESRLGRSWVRFVFGVIFLAIAMFLWGRFIFQIMDTLVGIIWFNAFVTLCFLILSSPIIASITMPEHGTNSKRHLAQIDEDSSFQSYKESEEDFSFQSFQKDYVSYLLDKFSKEEINHIIPVDCDVWLSEIESYIKDDMTDGEYEDFTDLLITDKWFEDGVKFTYELGVKKGVPSMVMATMIFQSYEDYDG